MSRKHNTRHDRSKSRYPERLRARGLGRSPRQPRLSDLRALHARRTQATGTPCPGLDLENVKEAS